MLTVNMNTQTMKILHTCTLVKTDYHNYPMFSDILCFRTPPTFHRTNYFLDAQKHVFRTPLVFGHHNFSPK